MSNLIPSRPESAIDNGDSLVAGILYCLVTIRWDHERNEDYNDFGSLLYWDGYDFVNEDGDVRHPDWDFVVPQSTTPTPEYISEPQQMCVNGEWMDRNEWRRRSLAQWRAECAARGVVVRA